MKYFASMLAKHSNQVRIVTIERRQDDFGKCLVRKLSDLTTACAKVVITKDAGKF